MCVQTDGWMASLSEFVLKNVDYLDLNCGYEAEIENKILLKITLLKIIQNQKQKQYTKKMYVMTSS